MNKFGKYFTLVIALIYLFAIFYNLTWGSPFAFHPDERNIASSVSQLNFYDNWNPHFFAYGTFPIYIIFISGVVIKSITSLMLAPSINFEMAIILSRFYSAILSIASIYLTYKIAKQYTGESWAKLTIIICTTSIAFLQYSRFGTFEIWLTFLYLILFYFCVKLLTKTKSFLLVIISIVLGLSIATKISSIIIVALPILCILITSAHLKKREQKIKYILRYLVTLIYFSTTSFVIFSPYVILDYASFRGSIIYEASVASGNLSVFYTGQFINTIPFIYQYLHVLPFIINPLITLVSIPALIFLFLKTVGKKDIRLFLLITTFSLLFISQSVLFVKWSRYLIPSIPYLAIIITIFVKDGISNQKLRNTTLVIISIVGLLYSFSFIKTVIFAQDTRIQASNYLKNKIPKDSKILSEIYDLGIIPFNSSFTKITLFNFYDLDKYNSKQKLSDTLAKSDYFIIPSQRLLKTRISNRDSFKEGNIFYNSLTNSRKYEIMYSTPCDIFCKTIYLGDPIYNFEETTSVFDRPSVLIYKIIHDES